MSANKGELGVVTSKGAEEAVGPSNNPKGWVDNHYGRTFATAEWKKAQVAELNEQLCNAKKQMTAVIFGFAKFSLTI